MNGRENGRKQNMCPPNDAERLRQMRAEAFGTPSRQRDAMGAGTAQMPLTRLGGVQNNPRRPMPQAEKNGRGVRDGRQAVRGGAAGADGPGEHYHNARRGQGEGTAQRKSAPAGQNGQAVRAASKPKGDVSASNKPAEGGIVLGSNTKRNLFLFTLLLLLVIVCVIVFGVQSCSNKKNTDTQSTPSKDKVQLSTPGGDKTGTGVKNSLFAETSDTTEALSVDSGYGILIDLGTNKVIASKGATDKIYPASMTKIMTLIVAYENIENLDDTYTFKAELLDKCFREGASVAGFLTDETVTVKDLLYGCILPSGADATGALAEYVAGSEEAFAVLMNKKAAEMGLKNTHFVTSSGLHDDDHYSTCEDMAAILRYAVNNQDTRQVLSAYKYTTSSTPQHPDGIVLTSTLKSRMAGDEADGVFVQGGKTGYTIEGKNCLATFAANCTEENADYATPRYILVTAYASGEYTPVFDAIDVYKTYCSP